MARARVEAARIVADAKADIQKDLNAAIATADAEIAAKSAVSAKRIAEVEAGAVDAVKTVAQDVTAELVVALGGTADADAIVKALSARLKG